jgi:hypothetical protein
VAERRWKNMAQKAVKKLRKQVKLFVYFLSASYAN